MTFRDKLVKLEACRESLEWVKGKTIKQAWKTCKNPDWMMWVLAKINLDMIDPICEMTEEVLDLVPEESQLACIWAISAARRRANKDELDAAYIAASIAYDAAIAVNCISAAHTSNAAYNAYYYAAAAVKYVAAAARISDIFNNATAFYYVSYAAIFAAAAKTANADANANVWVSIEERQNQCDILRKHFTIDQVREEFNKLVA